MTSSTTPSTITLEMIKEEKPELGVAFTYLASTFQQCFIQENASNIIDIIQNLLV